MVAGLDFQSWDCVSHLRRLQIECLFPTDEKAEAWFCLLTAASNPPKSGFTIRYCTTSINFTAWVNVVEPDLKVPVTVRL
jgi:hypothetical protein